MENSLFCFDEEIKENLPQQILELKIFKEDHFIEKMIQQNQFKSAEKWMMMGKAALFDDTKSFKIMSKVNSTKELKKMGRNVRYFKAKRWNSLSSEIVIFGNYLKFSQNEKLKQNLLDTDDSIIVEASPSDSSWGIGKHSFQMDESDLHNPNSNKLGKALMTVREILKN